MNVKDKVAVVTGGASGIGLALCTRFAREGAQVVLSDLRQEDCERRAGPIGAFPVAATSGARRTSHTWSRRPSTASGGSTCSTSTSG